ncbi:MAG: nuclear transport factor 2 family protein, partial [Bacteroidota bacterium]
MNAFEEYYSDEVVMQENEAEPRKGKAMNREQCGAFVATFPDLKLQVLSVAYGENVSIQEVHFDYTNAEDVHVEYPEVAVRHWADGQVVSEKFYYAS